MQKTQLTVLIEMIDSGIEGCTLMSLHGADATLEAKKEMLQAVRKDAIALLPKEREDMEKAFMNGAGTVFGCTSYFDTNYLQYKP